MTYSNKLNATKEAYPFEKWSTYFPGMDVYTTENCNRAKSIFDTLIRQLAAMGETAPRAEKEEQFKSAVLALNDLNEATDGGLIETGEREELCELLDMITIAAGLNPEDYADGEGIADEWREW
ncbi:MAG: hypothetical protein JNM22_17440 [Saprospiraceae bacterium]|nr:hypothetical protein [Saprospiraceae bacterium]